MSDTISDLRILLLEIGVESDVSAGTWLWREGDPGDEVVVVKEGRLQVVHGGAEGEPVPLRDLPAGSVLGEIACLDGETRSAAVRAVTNCRLSRIAAPRFRELLRRHPEILEALLLQQVRIVRSLTGQVTRTHRHAITDPLTRLYNFGFFNDRLALEIERAQETGDSVSIVLFDVDHFKKYNDTMGHQAGNDALVEVAELMRRSGRRGDVIARYGGEEFVALLYGADCATATRFAEAVREAIEKANFTGGERQPLGRVTVSGGVASFPADASTPNNLVEAADRRLYQAKQAGRNRIVVANGE